MKHTEHRIAAYPGVTKNLLVEAISSSTNGIVIADARKEDLPLIFVNPAFERMTGYCAEEAIGRNCRFLQGGNTRQKGLSSLRRAITTGQSCNVVLQNVRKDGTTFWNELFIAPIRDQHGTLTHFVGVQTDVTRRVESERTMKRLQRRLRSRNRELAGLNELKNELLGMAAHDIRNPLTTILWSCDALLDRLVGPMSEKQGTVTRRIKDAANYMLHLVNELLDVSKIESGKLELNRTVCNMAGLIKELSPIYRQRGNSKEIAVCTKTRAGDTAQVEVDRDKIQQVLDNLVSNAIKFSESGTRVDLIVETDRDSVVVSVRDRGQGIPESEQEKLFRPFSRTSVRATRGEKSTGLGLAICRKIVEAHGGSISVRSEVGKGSVFAFRLPRASG